MKGRSSSICMRCLPCKVKIRDIPNLCSNLRLHHEFRITFIKPLCQFCHCKFGDSRVAELKTVYPRKHGHTTRDIATAACNFLRVASSDLLSLLHSNSLLVPESYRKYWLIMSKIAGKTKENQPLARQV